MFTSKFLRNKFLIVLAIFGLLVMPKFAFCTDGEADRTLLSESFLKNSGFKVFGSMDLLSSYIWRGFTMDNDLVFQPSVNVCLYGFTFSVWSNWDARNNDEYESNEIDYTIDYTHEFKYFSLSGGVIYYDFIQQDTFTKEWYTGITFNKLFFSPGVFFYNDWGKEENGGGDGQYIVAKVSHSVPLSFLKFANVTLDINSHVAFNNKQFIEGEGGDFLIGAALTIPVVKALNLKPSLSYSLPFGDLKNSSDGNQSDRLFGGVSVEYEF